MRFLGISSLQDLHLRLYGLNRHTEGALKPAIAARKARNASTIKYLAPVVAALLFLQFFLVLGDSAASAHPLVQMAYSWLFAMGALVSAAATFVWFRWPAVRGQTSYVTFLMLLGVGMALCDLQLSGDFSAYILVLFGTALIFGAPIAWYGISFSISWLLLVTGISLSHATTLGLGPVAASGVLTVFGIVAGIILETRRVRTDILTFELGRKTQEWKEASLRDELTGLYNRRFLFEWIEPQISYSRRTGQPLTVALIDLDHFKAVNDNAGHEVGDRVLRSAARCFERSFRKSDILARYGGEEFLVVFPDTDAEQARPIVERCLQAFPSLQVPGWPQGVTFSAGLTALQPGETVKEWFQRVDDLMYHAKNAGRNQIVTGV